jgi:acetyl esterase/lipase
MTARCVVRAVATACLLWAAGASAAPLNLPIWPDPAAAGGEPGEPREQDSTASWHEHFIRNVRQASIDVYLPDPSPDSSRTSGTGMVVCPGGAFRFLTMEGEGERIAHWLNARGIAAFVLHYRLKPTPHSELLFLLQMLYELPPLLNGSKVGEIKPLAGPAIADGVQALRFVRARAAQWQLKPGRLGMIGFSAGGMVALGTSLTTQAQDRPDFSAAIYSGPLDVAPVPADAPPLFAAAAADDPLTTLATQPIAAAWKAAGAPVELHIYQHGGHGFKKGTDSEHWTEDFGAWVQVRHL